MLADAQKAYKNTCEEGEGEKVHILETFEDSDSDSESFSIKVQQLTGMNVGQTGGDGEGESSKHVWFMQGVLTSGDNLPHTKDVEMLIADVITKESSLEKLDTPLITDNSGLNHTTLSPEVFLTDDNIVNTPESVDVGLGSQEDVVPTVTDVVKTNASNQIHIQEAPMSCTDQGNQNRRRSE